MFFDFCVEYSVERVLSTQQRSKYSYYRYTQPIKGSTPCKYHPFPSRISALRRPCMYGDYLPREISFNAGKAKNFKGTPCQRHQYRLLATQKLHMGPPTNGVGVTRCKMCIFSARIEIFMPGQFTHGVVTTVGGA